MSGSCLTKEQSAECFKAGFLSCFAEKRAQHGFALAPYIKDIGGVLKGVWSGGKELLSAAGTAATMGAGSGVLGALAADVIKEQLTREDPKVKLSGKLEKLYAGKSRELDDSQWMARVRAMRDELRRGYKKMTVEEYRDKYNNLVKALDERKA